MTTYQTDGDLKNESLAMELLSLYFRIPFRKGNNPKVDFCSTDKTYVCEHKYRNLDEEGIENVGGTIFFEKRKYNNLMWAIRNGGKVPLFIVTLKNKNVYYVDVRDCDVRYISATAYRNNPRDEFDSDDCYLIPFDEFKYIGTTLSLTSRA